MPRDAAAVLKRVQEAVNECRRWRVEQQGDLGNARRNLLEQLNPFAAQRPQDGSEAGHIAAWARQAGDVAAAHGVGNQHENDGNGACLLQHRPGGRCGAHKDEVGPKLGQFVRKSFHRLESAAAQRVSISIVQIKLSKDT